MILFAHTQIDVCVWQLNDLNDIQLWFTKNRLLAIIIVFLDVLLEAVVDFM